MWRRRIDGKDWHIARLCPWWPATNYESSEDPAFGTLCPKCRHFHGAGVHVRHDLEFTPPALAGLEQDF